MSKRPKTRRRPLLGGARGRRIGAALALVTVVLLALFALARREPPGTLTPEHEVHPFGQVPIDGGLLAAEFPLEIQGTVVVTSLGTT